MKDSPLKALVVANAVNGSGHVVLCNLLHYGITGEEWPQMASQACRINISIFNISDFAYLIRSCHDIFNNSVFYTYALYSAAADHHVFQIVAAYTMIEALKNKGFTAFSISVPSRSEFLQIFGIASQCL